MPEKPRFKFSRTFPGVVWNTLAVPDTRILILEIRDDKNFQVHFSALDFSTNKFLWENVKFNETWWIGFTAANAKTILFHTYINKGNPDHKNLFAYDIFDQKIRWEVSEFSFFSWNESTIWGYRTQQNEFNPATISLETGVLAEGEWKAEREEELAVEKPTRYLEGTPHFETIKKFIQQKTSQIIVGGVEYLEWEGSILVSAYVNEGSKLANYLLVFDKDGELMMQEKLAENLTGLGTDTFFMLSGCLILVKNRTELVVYQYD